jgi:hypothetical protein
MQNIQRLVNRLEEESVGPNNATAPTMMITVMDTFYNKTFAEQVQFFANHDIIVSPHGAQWTALPFLPACGCALELFPNSRYVIPEYFGSLAAAANLSHSYLVMLQVDEDNNINDNNNTAHCSSSSSSSSHKEEIADRVAARSVPLCPPVKKVVEAIQQLVEEWYKCVTAWSMEKGSKRVL